MNMAMMASSSSFSTTFSKVPLTALSERGKVFLSHRLNPIKVLFSEEGYPRDWRGIAHLAGLQTLYGATIISNKDQIGKVIQLWCNEADNQTATFDNLIKFLQIIDRWDVADDILDFLVADAEAFENQKRRDETVPISNKISIDSESDEHILTSDDSRRAIEGLEPQRYDAFILFADEDIEFATDLIERMESPSFNFKLCVKERDLVGGITFEHDAIRRLISERCNRLIVIVSEAFLQSPANTFFVNYAQALQIEKRKRKIIPCVLSDSFHIPENLSFYFLLRYYRTGKIFDFWKKLGESIRYTPPVAATNTMLQTLNATPPRLMITEVDSTNEETPMQPLVQPEPTSESFIPIKIPRKKTSQLHNNSSLSESDSILNSSMRERAVSMSLLPNGIEGVPLNSVSDTKGGSLKNIPEASKKISSEKKWYKKLLRSSISKNSIPDEGKLNNSGESQAKSNKKKNFFQRRRLVSANSS